MGSKPEQTKQKFLLHAAEVAYFEAAGWKAYYDRDWLKLLGLIVSLCHAQFHIPFPVSLLAAYDIVRASAAWAPANHNVAQVQAYYTRFYRLARRYSGLNFDPAEAGRLETQYNIDHRRLSGSPDKTDFIQTMVQLHSTLFGITEEAARPSAELRVLANNTVDLITSGASKDIAADWRLLEGYLRDCYASIADCIQP
jgi:hypothetical protein